MKDLRKYMGLEVKLKDNFKLELDIALLGGEFSSRTLTDIRKVLKDKIKITDDPIYFMYRDVRERDDDEKIKNASLRFDITVILPRILGSEFNKTLGHYHPLKEGTNTNYSEVYEVVSGKALCLLQKPDKNPAKIESCYLVEVNEGEKIIMPSGFGHITINPLTRPLVMTNWVSDDFSSDYEDIKKYHGGCYYIVEKENNKLGLKRNKNYKSIPEIIKARPKEQPRLGLKFNQPMYISGTRYIDKLKFLNFPEEHTEELKPENIFELS